MRDVTLLSMKNKSVQNCRFVLHAKFHCIMTTLNKLFKIEFERWGGGTGKEPYILISRGSPRRRKRVFLAIFFSRSA